jgi:hypothetical protein
MAVQVKSAFQPIRPRIDTELQAKLASSPVVASSTRTATKQHPSNGRGPERKAPIPTGTPVNVAIKLLLESINNPQKAPIFAYTSPPQDRDLTITIVYNAAWWPASGALQRGDQNAIKWLGALALVDRILCWRGHPVLKAVGDYLAQLTGCLPEFKRGTSWCAYALKDH